VKLHATYVNLKNDYLGFWLTHNAKMEAFGINTSQMTASVFRIDNSELKNTFSNYNLQDSFGDVFAVSNGGKLTLGNSTFKNGSLFQAAVSAYGGDVTMDTVSITDHLGIGVLVAQDPDHGQKSSLNMSFSDLTNLGGDGILAFDESNVMLNTVDVSHVNGLGVGLFDSTGDLKRVELDHGVDSGLALFASGLFSHGATVTGNDLKLHDFPNAGIFSADSTVHVSDSEVMNNGYGAQVFSGMYEATQEPFELTGSRVADNKLGIDYQLIGDHEDAASYDVKATDDWWGGPSGPLSATQNCTGEGNMISDGVVFSPWVTSSNFEGRTPADPTSCDGVVIDPIVHGSSDGTTLEHKLELKAKKLEELENIRNP
jgi:hypothetical protein